MSEYFTFARDIGRTRRNLGYMQNVSGRKKLHVPNKNDIQS